MNEDWMGPWQRKMWKEMVVARPPEIAYLVGGPADGQEQEVSAGTSLLHWAEAVPITAASLTETDLYPTVPSARIHSYKPCPETGEWLWQGAR